MTALRAAVGPLLIAASTVGAAWLLIWSFSFGGRFAALCRLASGTSRGRRRRGVTGPVLGLLIGGFAAPPPAPAAATAAALGVGGWRHLVRLRPRLGGFFGDRLFRGVFRGLGRFGFVRHAHGGILAMPVAPGTAPPPAAFPRGIPAAGAGGLASA